MLRHAGDAFLPTRVSTGGTAAAQLWTGWSRSRSSLPKRKLLASIVTLATIVAGTVALQPWPPAFAALSLQLPWPTGVGHAINGGNTYGCGLHVGRDGYAIDFQVGGPTTSTNDDDARISAVASGRAYAFPGYNDGYGNVVMISHDGGIASLYAHIQDAGFVGSFPRPVSQGDVIALAGGTGGVPAHLHFAMRSGSSDPPKIFAGSALRPEPMSGYSGFGSYGIGSRDGCRKNVASPKFLSKPPTSPPPGGTTLPNLRPTAITFDQSTAVTGRSIYFDSGIENVGNANSGGFNIRWLVDGRDVGAYGGHAGVPAGQTVLNGNSQFSWIFNSAGSHTVGFLVDVDNNVKESNEQDNSRGVTFSVGTSTVCSKSGEIRIDPSTYKAPPTRWDVAGPSYEGNPAIAQNGATHFHAWGKNNGKFEYYFPNPNLQLCSIEVLARLSSEYPSYTAPADGFSDVTVSLGAATAPLQRVRPDNGSGVVYSFKFDPSVLAPGYETQALEFDVGLSAPSSQYRHGLCIYGKAAAAGYQDDPIRVRYTY